MRLNSIEEILAHFRLMFEADLKLMFGCWSLKRPNRIVLCLKIINSLVHYSNGCQLQVIINHERCAVDGFFRHFFGIYEFKVKNLKNRCWNLRIINFHSILHFIIINCYQIIITCSVCKNRLEIVCIWSPLGHRIAVPHTEFIFLFPFFFICSFSSSIPWILKENNLRALFHRLKTCCCRWSRKSLLTMDMCVCMLANCVI